MNEFEIDLTGDKELIDKLKKLENRTAITALKKALRKSGHIIKRSAQQEAPIESGNLRKSIKVFSDRSYGSKNGALVRIGADKNIAPHAHLVEFGTDERELKKPTKVNLGDGRFFTLKHTGKMTANNFFERGYNSSKESAIEKFRNEIKKEIDNAVR